MLQRYYGYYANRTRGERRKAQEALTDVAGGEAGGTDAQVVPPDAGLAVDGVTIVAPGVPRGDARRRWAELLRLIYEVDPLLCPKCGGQMRVIALIQAPMVIDQILRHLRDQGRDARAGPWAPGPGLDLGADDYMAKPFSPTELVSRAQAVLRRAQAPGGGDVVTVDDDLQIDFRTREVVARGQRIKLRPTEWRLLYHLVHNAGWLLTHDAILSKVWGPEYQGQDNYVRLYVTYLRQKIEPDPAHPRYILTERGTGYRFVDFAGKREVPRDIDA